MAEKPILIKPIPSQITNEKAAFGPVDLKQFIRSPDKESGELLFRASLADGRTLPPGVICTSDGLINGIPATGTAGIHEVLVEVKNDADEKLVTQFTLTIKPSLATEDPYFLTNLKSKVWEALGQDLPLPNLGDILNRPVTPIEVYYLLQRWATLTVWDVYNLDFPSEKQLIELPGASKHYFIYDRGSCLVGTPKDLYSYERTLEDALQTARVIAREVYRRGWTIEFAGFNKMVRAAWVELQVLGEKHGKQLEILHYSPSQDDFKVYAAKAKDPNLRGPG